MEGSADREGAVEYRPTADGHEIRRIIAAAGALGKESVAEARSEDWIGNERKRANG